MEKERERRRKRKGREKGREGECKRQHRVSPKIFVDDDLCSLGKSTDCRLDVSGL